MEQRSKHFSKIDLNVVGINWVDNKIPEEINGKYNYLDDEQIVEKLYDFKDGEIK